MDPFTQNILERAEKRAAALGITNTSKFPLSEFNYETDKPATGASPKKKPSGSKKHSAPKTPAPVQPASSTVTTVSTRTAADGDRTTTVDVGGQDNCDLALEINITTSANLQVDLGVKELESDGSVKKQWEHNIVRAIEEGMAAATAKDGTAASGPADGVECEKENDSKKNIIRDQSRNQLQRLGKLYSETQDLSSPVHRTEGRFHEELKDGARQPKAKLAKLATLADSINNWEDDTSHPDIKHHRETIVPGREKKSPHRNQESPKRGGPTSHATVTGATPKKYPAPNPPKSILSPQKPSSGSTGGEAGSSGGTAGKTQQTKSLKWDQKVMDTLESQGFQRRESTAPKLVYDYKDDGNEKRPESERPPQAMKVEKPTAAAKVTDVKKSSNQSTEQKKPLGASKGGMVSGRAAMFEKSSGRRQSILKPGQKDPAEMSLKERMAIFEKNKGAALVPKAAFGISPSIRQITGQKEGPSTASSSSGIQGFGSITGHQAKMGVAPSSPQSKPKVDHGKSASKIETMANGSAIRNTVAALMSNASTISESQIAEENRRQRQQEMEQLLNRFSKPADMSSDLSGYDGPRPIPSAPPMPPEGYLTSSGKKKKPVADGGHSSGAVKRRSDGTSDSPGVMASLDDVKRIRVATAAKDGRMYPALSDIETTATESGDDAGVGDDYTTATVSGSETSDDRAYRTANYGEKADMEALHDDDVLHSADEEQEDEVVEEEEDEEYEDEEQYEDDDRWELIVDLLQCFCCANI